MRGRKKVPYERTVAATHPDLAARWCSDNEVLPDEITAGSHVIVRVRCPSCEEVREGRLQKLARSSFCRAHAYQEAGRKIAAKRAAVLQVGVNDLATTHPEWAERITEDSAHGPSEVWASSLRPITFICFGICGKPLTKAASVAVQAPLCQSCASGNGRAGYIQKELKVRSLAKLRPELAALFTPESPHSPDEVLVGSYQWIQAGCIVSGCPRIRLVKVRDLVAKDGSCGKHGKHVSKWEAEVAGFLTSCGVEVRRNVRGVLSSRSEIDILLPELGLGVELNGQYWHSDKAVAKTRRGEFGTAAALHITKYERARAKGVELAFVWEDDWSDHRLLVETALRRFIHSGKRDYLLSHLSNRGDVVRPAMFYKGELD